VRRKSRDPTLGRREAAEFRLAHLVAFQHAIFHSIPGGDGIHGLEVIKARAISPRENTHTFHDRWTARMKYGFAPLGYIGCHSERSEESLISSGAIHTGTAEMFHFAQHDSAVYG
jgi:hypothetical protein